MATVKASRRALFRSLFGRAGFELQLEDAHDLLMRLSRSLDPIPVTDGMWASHLANRRRLRYLDRDQLRASSAQELAQAVDEAVARASFDGLPPHLVPDLELLLRVEALLQVWEAASAATTASGASAVNARDLLSALEREIVRYVERTQPGDTFPRELIEEVAAHLSTIAANRSS